MKLQSKPFSITVILALFFLLSACANKNQVSEEKLPDNTPGNQVEISTANDSLPESDSHSNQVDNSSASESSPESVNHSVVTDLSLNDDSVIIGDISLSLSESRQDILAKLEAAGFDDYDDYGEVQPDSTNEVSYDLYYNAAGCLQIYFLDDACVRIRLQKFDDSLGNPQTARGLHPRDTYSQMIELYGDDYETHAYSYKGIYTIYRYSIGDCICEFGIEGENRDSIYNIDIYLPSQLPIYEYGEEITGT